MIVEIGLITFPCMLKDFDMELVLQQNFFSEQHYNTDDIQLLHRMKAFDPRRVNHSNVGVHNQLFNSPS